MEIYGLYGITHGWGRLLTVMSAAGRAATAAAIDPGPDVSVVEGEGRLTQYHEKRQGALARLVDAHDIQVLSKATWDAKKKDLGALIW